jgi:hypothetical protein
MRMGSTILILNGSITVFMASLLRDAPGVSRPGIYSALTLPSMVAVS